MDIRAALKGQYHAGLAMVREAILACPDELWAATCGSKPRTCWRIAYHCVFYTHLYLAESLETFQPWPRHVRHGRILWDDDEEGMPPDETTLTQADLAEYVDWVDARVDGWVDAMDLGSERSGFDWYPVSKLEHQVVNIRHLGVHLGQLQELLYAAGKDPDNWIGTASARAQA